MLLVVHQCSMQEKFLFNICMGRYFQSVSSYFFSRMHISLNNFRNEKILSSTLCVQSFLVHTVGDLNKVDNELLDLFYWLCVFPRIYSCFSSCILKGKVVVMTHTQIIHGTILCLFLDPFIFPTYSYAGTILLSKATRKKENFQ